MRYALLGGTFDPVHNGHIAIAAAGAKAAGAQAVLLIPTGLPPHKPCPFGSREERLEMLRLASNGLFDICTDELYRSTTTYTYDTLTALKARMPDAEFTYIIGSDTLEVVDRWYRFDDVCALCEFVVVMRGDDVREQAEATANALRGRGARIAFADEAGPEISSTDLRALLAAGQTDSASRLMPPAAARYAAERGIYRWSGKRAEIERWLADNLSAHRMEHTRGVEHMAVLLAERWGADRLRASMAALLHDCAKELGDEELLRLAGSGAIPSDAMMRENPFMLHAQAGAYLARTRFGITDEAVLDAVASHIFGGENMTLLSKIIFVADIAERTRDFDGVEEIRAAAFESIDRACLLECVSTVSHLFKLGKAVHPAAIATYNALISPKGERE